MPGGTASNIVAYIAKGDMPLSVMMTTASTLAAVFTTPILTSLLVGTLVPVDATAMFLSTLQLVLAPVLAGAALNQFAPKVGCVGVCGCVCVVLYSCCARSPRPPNHNLTQHQTPRPSRACARTRPFSRRCS